MGAYEYGRGIDKRIGAERKGIRQKVDRMAFLNPQLAARYQAFDDNFLKTRYKGEPNQAHRLRALTKADIDRKIMETIVANKGKKVKGKSRKGASESSKQRDLLNIEASNFDFEMRGKVNKNTGKPYKRIPRTVQSGDKKGTKLTNAQLAAAIRARKKRKGQFCGCVQKQGQGQGIRRHNGIGQVQKQACIHFYWQVRARKPENQKVQR